MTSVTVEEAQARLPELIAQLHEGEAVVITRDERPIAKLVGEVSPGRQPRQPGSAIGKFFILTEDEEHLKDFKEYMP